MQGSSGSSIQKRKYSSPENVDRGDLTPLAANSDKTGSSKKKRRSHTPKLVIEEPAPLTLAAAPLPQIQVEVCSIPCDDLQSRLAKIYALAIQRYNEHALSQAQNVKAA